MPVERKGFLFQYFDKIIFAVVVLGLVATIIYAVQRKASAAKQIDVAAILDNVQKISRKLTAEPPPASVPQYTAAQRQAVAPGTVRQDLVWPPLPQQYPPFRVGPDKEFIIEFMEPMLKGSLQVDAGDASVQIIEHPVDNDYRKVRARSGSAEGTVKITGMAADVPHIRNVIVDAKVGKTAYAPLDLAVADSQGLVALQFKDDPRIGSEEVEVAGYEVWRRDWSDPLGEFRKVGTSGMGEAGSRGRGGPTGMPPAPGGEMFIDDPMLLDGGMGMPGFMLPPEMTGGAMPSRRRGTRLGAQEPAEALLSWQDYDVKPGERYSYKLRAIGNNTYPTEGDFTDPIMVEVLPSIDFKATGQALDKVRFEIVKQSASGRGLVTAEFHVAKGSEIGGVDIDPRTGVVENYLTGYVLVDYHRSVRRPEGGVASRIIYADGEGNLFSRWQGETKSALWERGAGGRGGMGMPGGVLPDMMGGGTPPGGRVPSRRRIR